MNTYLHWLRNNYKYLSLYTIERELKLPNKTLYKFATSERDLPEKYQAEVTDWIKEFKKDKRKNNHLMQDKITGLNSSELYQKALKAYIAVCKRKKLLPRQPTELASEIKGDFLYLKNGSDLIKIYNYRKERFASEPIAK